MNYAQIFYFVSVLFIKNRIRRARAHREKAITEKTNTVKSKQEKSEREFNTTELIELQRKQRQAIPNTSINNENNNNNVLPADKSYDFGFRTSEYDRREKSDSLGRVNGLYSYVDDVGEKHFVRYAASADRGFEVLNAVPDAFKYVQYNAPLYKTSPKTRGRIAYERGPGKLYNFVSAGPDQRRMESRGPDGVTRGMYSYLDDKGVQRTTQYIAGAGIGYRTVESTGQGTHLLPQPLDVEFGLLYPQNAFGGINDDKNNGGVTPGNDFSPDGNSGTSGTGVGGAGAGSLGGAGGFDNSLDSEGGFGDFDSDANRPDVTSGNADADLPKRGRGFGTIITNSGDTYLGVAPGASVRAHVQNIDLRPFGDGGTLTPGEALKRDERRSLRLRFRG